MIDVALLGSGGSMPIPNRFLASALISYQGRKILIDCGEGCQVSMKILGWGFKTIDVICITHLHGDHIYGLFGLLSTIGNSGREDSITLLGPKGMNDLVKVIKILLPYLPYELIVYENPKEYTHNTIIINTLALEHSSDCLGYSFYLRRNPKFDREKAEKNNVPKILWSKLQKGDAITFLNKVYTPDMVLGQPRKGIKISYITDTRPIDEIVPFIHNSELFICEGTYAVDQDIEKAKANKHMTFHEAGKLASKGNVKELILTHFSPALIEPSVYLENVKEVFPNTTIGEDHLTRSYNFNNG